MKSLHACILAAALGVSCAAGGYKSPGSHDLPSNGAGPYRALAPEEMVGGKPVVTNGLIESGMAARVDDDTLVFVYVNATAGTRDQIDPASPWLSNFGPRSIRRSPLGAGPGFIEGDVLLSASAAWEGTEVFDPWMIKLPSGGFRLYYAAAGGIGAAQSDSADGAFTRIGDGPVLASGDLPTFTGTPRHPSVLHDGTRFVMYFESGNHLGVAYSGDGLAWTEPTRIWIDYDGSDILREPNDPPPSDVVSFGAPAAVWRTPSVGTPFVHVVFEARFADGSRRLVIAGSYDHRVFEAATVPAIAKIKNPGSPALIPGDGVRVSVLYFSGDQTIGGKPGRSVYAAVSPGDFVFMPEAAQ